MIEIQEKEKTTYIKNKFQEINNRDELLEMLGISKKHLSYILHIKKTENSYTLFTIPKKNGGVRYIYSPIPQLKIIQVRLAKILVEHHEYIRKKSKNNISHGYEKGKGIITNASVHRNKKLVLNIDLENFFESIHFGRVKGYFQKNSNLLFPEKLATLIAQIACYNGFLPQGSPCSPIISNLICSILDRRILVISKKYKLSFTRYADDLTFSTSDMTFIEKKDMFYEEMLREINKAGFIINEQKTRLQYKDSRQVVTGLTVNKKINVSREFYKETRSMANHLYKYGKFTINNESASIEQLEGRFNFIYQVDKYNKKFEKQKKYSNRDNDYRKFLFYKYFFANKDPLIITEGKTDPRYIKAALKNLYKDYPDLVEKDDDDFKFKVNFLKRTNEKFEYFFELTKDGGDSLKKLHNFYNGYHKQPNLNKYFRELTKSFPNKPIIILLDNEPKDGLGTFLKFIGASNTSNPINKKIKKEFNSFLIGNLYLLTIPKEDETPKSDIEDLFSKETLEVKLEGKAFSRDNDSSKPNTFGKDQFSKFVTTHYSAIDFSNFRGLLNNINSIIKNMPHNS